MYMYKCFQVFLRFNRIYLIFRTFIYVLKCNSREFTHRVKSVSMAKFTSQEVSALQGGGNAVSMKPFIRIFLFIFCYLKYHKQFVYFYSLSCVYRVPRKFISRNGIRSVILCLIAGYFDVYMICCLSPSHPLSLPCVLNILNLV